MKTYTPTSKQLKEMGFEKQSDNEWSIWIWDCMGLWYESIPKYWYVMVWYEQEDVYPKDKEHIMKLISLFTPND